VRDYCLLDLWLAITMEVFESKGFLPLCSLLFALCSSSFFVIQRRNMMDLPNMCDAKNLANTMGGFAFSFF
jgi:hypothetical protein